MNRTALIIICLLLSCAACFGQSAFKGLTSGQSTHTDVEHVLGKPATKASDGSLPNLEWKQERNHKNRRKPKCINY